MAKVRKSTGSIVFDTANYAFMILLTFSFLYPFIYIISVSVSAAGPVMRNEIWLYPRGKLDVWGYVTVLNDPTILRAYFNTIVYCLTAVAIGIFLTANIAYGLSISNLRGRMVFTFILTIPMFIGGGLIPTVLTVQAYGLMDTLWALILPNTVSLFYVIILRTNFQALPTSLRESAYMDGANHFKIMLRIYLPLSKPILATLSLWIIVGQWNSFFPALLYLIDDDKYPLQLVLRKLIIEQIQRGGASTDDVNMIVTDQVGLTEKLKMAAILVSIGPIILVYPFPQRYFIKGTLIGSIKG